MSFRKPTERESAIRRETEDLTHAMQSGVKFDQESGSTCGTPKHLRVGVNKALVEHAALLVLLEEKGLIDAEDYWELLRESMGREVEKYEALLSEKFGRKVTLG